MALYCIRCKRKTESANVRSIVSRNKRLRLQGKCLVCKNTKSQFVRKHQKGGDFSSRLNSVTSKIKLPWTRFKGEMHLPGMHFAGPGTNLNKRLMPNGEYHNWSKPVDRVDEAAYHHDLAYQQFSDTPNRNIADKAMLKQMDAIINPSIRERIERAIIKPIISTKVMLGLGI